MTYRSMQQQTGAVLATSMIMLLILTILTVAAVQVGIVENRMGSNINDINRSFQATESALREGETYVLNLTAMPVPSTSCGTSPCVYTNDSNRQPENRDAAWWNANSATYSSSTIQKVYAQPQYVIEFLRFVPDNLGFNAAPTGKYYYRITARGTGATAETVVILQSTVMKRF